MECPFCKSSNIKNLKVHIVRPFGAKKHKCLQCNQSFIKTKNNNNNNSLQCNQSFIKTDKNNNNS